MHSILDMLYEELVWRHKNELSRTSSYAKALTGWRTVQREFVLELEDSADVREYEWGLLAFAVGLQCGIGVIDESRNILSPRP